MNFDLEAYLGTWYQIARNNAWYEIGCKTSAAVYSMQADQLVIKNYCYEEGIRTTNGAPEIPFLGSQRMISGFATPTRNPLVFDITFETGQQGKYNILFTDYFYYAIIGDPKTKYVSVLSREYTITEKEKSLLTKILRDYGFTNFEWTI